MVENASSSVNQGRPLVSDLTFVQTVSWLVVVGDVYLIEPASCPIRHTSPFVNPYGSSRHGTLDDFFRTQCWDKVLGQKVIRFKE